jgi:hypothetical protein
MCATFVPDESFWMALHERCASIMRDYDRYPRDIRDLIKEFNIAPVTQLHAMGMTDAAQIREVLQTRAVAGDAAAQQKFRDLRSGVVRSFDRALVRPSRQQQAA